MYNPKYENPGENVGRFEAMGAEIGRLVDRKHAAYGGGIYEVHRMLKLLFPEIGEDRLFMISLFSRDFDKCWRLGKGDPSAFSENPYMDRVGYMLLAYGWWEENKHRLQDPENE